MSLAVSSSGYQFLNQRTHRLARFEMVLWRRRHVITHLSPRVVIVPLHYLRIRLARGPGVSEDAV